MAEFRMPALGADMEAGTLVAFRRKPGESIRRGEILAEVETEKGVIEVECFTTGTVGKYLIEPGSKVPVGTPMAIIDDGSTAEAERHEPASSEVAAPAGAIQHAPGSPSARKRAREESTVTRTAISPAARRRARELGIAVETLHPPAGHSTFSLRDLEPPVSAPKPASSGQAMRRAIAQAMTRSKREIPHYYVSTTIDFAAAKAWLDGYNGTRAVSERLLSAALLLKAVALATRQTPELNAHFIDGEAHARDAVHLGCAVSLRGGGLVAPAIHDADKLALPALMSALDDVVSRARSGRLRSSELSDASLTVTNLGERGVESVLPIIHPPQTAIVGFGRISERPWVVAGQVVPRPLVHATLAGDHRTTDGHLGARFLGIIDQLLQEPEAL